MVLLSFLQILFVCASILIYFNLILNIFFKIPMEKMNAKNVSGTETADNVRSRCCGLSRNMLMAIVQGFFAHQVKIVHLIIEKQSHALRSQSCLRHSRCGSGHTLKCNTREMFKGLERCSKQSVNMSNSTKKINKRTTKEYLRISINLFLCTKTFSKIYSNSLKHCKTFQTE